MTAQPIEAAAASLKPSEVAAVRGALLAALPHLGDATILALAHARLTVNGGVLEVLATDRYTAIKARTDVPLPDMPAAYMSTRSLKEAAQVLGRDRRCSSLLTLTMDEFRVTPQWPGGFYNAPTYTWRHAAPGAFTYPNVDRLFTDALKRARSTEPHHPPASINPAIVGRFATNARFRDSTAWFYGDTIHQPVLLAQTIYSDVRVLGLVMPVRLEESALARLEGWS